MGVLTTRVSPKFQHIHVWQWQTMEKNSEFHVIENQEFPIVQLIIEKKPSTK